MDWKREGVKIGGKVCEPLNDYPLCEPLSLEPFVCQDLGEAGEGGCCQKSTVHWLNSH